MADERSGDLTYDIPAAVQGQTAIDPHTYQQMYERSVRDPEGFWAEHVEEQGEWFLKWDEVPEWHFD